MTDSQFPKCRTAVRPRRSKVLFRFGIDGGGGGGAISLFFFRVIFPPPLASLLFYARVTHHIGGDNDRDQGT